MNENAELFIEYLYNNQIWVNVGHEIRTADCSNGDEHF